MARHGVAPNQQDGRCDGMRSCPQLLSHHLGPEKRLARAAGRLLTRVSACLGTSDFVLCDDVDSSRSGHTGPKARGLLCCRATRACDVIQEPVGHKSCQCGARRIDGLRGGAKTAAPHGAMKSCREASARTIFERQISSVGQTPLAWPSACRMGGTRGPREKKRPDRTSRESLCRPGLPSPARSVVSHFLRRAAHETSLQMTILCRGPTAVPGGLNEGAVTQGSGPLRR